MAIQHHLDQPLMSVNEIDISPGFESQVSIYFFGTLPFCALGAQINPPPLIWVFRFFLILAPAGGSNPAGPYLNLFHIPAGQT